MKYKSRDPFLPFLYSNQLGCRIVVSPLRTWIQPICNVCTPTKDKSKLETLMAEVKARKKAARDAAKAAKAG